MRFILSLNKSSRALALQYMDNEPMPKPSVKAILLQSPDSFQPETLYSTER